MKYENEDDRIHHLGRIAGVSPEIIRIFTSRIPKEYVKITSSGRRRTHDGDKIILPVLDRLYDLKGVFQDDTFPMKNISVMYKLKHRDPENRTISFKRFVLNEYLLPAFPKGKTSVSNRKVFFPIEVPILELSQEEVDVLYEWLNASDTPLTP